VKPVNAMSVTAKNVLVIVTRNKRYMEYLYSK
jgi:hypothetical protein